MKTPGACSVAARGVERWYRIGPVAEPAEPQEAGAGQQQAEATPFRFYDNRQKYLAFVNTCNEKAVIAVRARARDRQLGPTPAGAPDVRRRHGRRHRPLAPPAHRAPPVPDRARCWSSARRSASRTSGSALDKMPDRFYEHPAHGARGHEPELQGRPEPEAAATRARPRSTGTRCRSRERPRRSSGSRSRRWDRSSRTAGRRSRTRRPATRRPCIRRCSCSTARTTSSCSTR